MTKTSTWAAVVLGLLLFALHIYPYPPHTHTPLVGGVLPAPLFFWMLWTALMLVYVAWIAFYLDPFSWLDDIDWERTVRYHWEEDM